MIDQDEIAARFGDLVAELNSAMIVVTTAAYGERSGCLVGFHTQCSIDPPQYAVWLSKANHTADLIDSATHFAVHVLRSSDQPLAEWFGSQTGDEIDKFEQCAWSEGPGGVPVLDSCSSHFVGRKVAVADVGGDHRCVVLEPVRVEVGSVGSMPLRLSDESDLTPGHPS